MKNRCLEFPGSSTLGNSIFLAFHPWDRSGQSQEACKLLDTSITRKSEIIVQEFGRKSVFVIFNSLFGLCDSIRTLSSRGMQTCFEGELCTI